MRIIISIILIATITSCSTTKNRNAESSSNNVIKEITSKKIPVDKSLDTADNEKFDEIAIEVCNCLAPIRKVKEKYTNPAADQSNFAAELQSATQSISGCMGNFNNSLVQYATTHEKRASVLNKIRNVCPDAAEMMFPTK